MRDLKKVLAIEGNKKKYLNTLIKEGLYSGAQLAIIAGTLHIRTLFIFRGNRLEIPVQYHSFKGIQEHLVLVDSSVATHYFIKVARTTMSLGWR
jgi:hypothetical protein